MTARAGGEEENGKATEEQQDKECAENPEEYLTFLYQLTEGAAGKSYGLNVARLAQLPQSVLREAAVKSRHLEDTILSRRFEYSC